MTTPKELAAVPGVRVKALEWADTGQMGFLETRFYAVSGPLRHTCNPVASKDGPFFEHYSIRPDGEKWHLGFWVGNNGRSGVSGVFDTVEQAQAAAQADHDARYVSELEPAPAPETAGVVLETTAEERATLLALATAEWGDEDRQRCRDCADEDGRCPHSGKACDPLQRLAEAHPRVLLDLLRDHDTLTAALAAKDEHLVKSTDAIIALGTDRNAAVRRAEQAEARVAALVEAAEPFADISDLMDTEAEGLAETDEFQLMFHDLLIEQWPLSVFRALRAATSKQSGGGDE